SWPERQEATCLAGTARQAAPAITGSVDQQGATAPAVTPAQTSALVTQPASTTSDRLSLVIGVGLRVIESTELFLGVVNLTDFDSVGLAAADRPSGTVTASPFVPLHSWVATLPATLPRSFAFFQTKTVWVPSATRLRAALSPSWPPIGMFRPTASSAWTAPVAMPSFSDSTASMSLLLAARAASMFVRAPAVSQLAVFCSNT